MITKNDIPAKFLFCLEMARVLEKYLKEVNQQTSFVRRQAHLAPTFLNFMDLSFFWGDTSDGFCFWFKIAMQEKEGKK